MGDTKSSMHGTTAQNEHRFVQPSMQPLANVMERGLMGQMVNPPNTAISVPQQQAATLAQAGPFGAADYLGVGATKSLAAGPNQAGLQSRAQLGLPDRSSYFSFMPTAEQVQSLGMLSPLGPETAQPAKLDKQQAKLAKLEAKPKQGKQRVAKEAALSTSIGDLKKRNPEYAKGK
jgi:hypothetical protein